MAKIEVVVCDFCHTVGRETETVEICEEDAETLRQLYAPAQRQTRAPRKPGIRKTVAEIEALKTQKAPRPARAGRGG